MSAVSGLIEVVQSVTQPRDRIPAPPQTKLPTGRAEPPTWVLEASPDLAPVDLESEIILQPADIPDASNDSTTEHPDVAAYYLPFHFYRSRWGIYVRLASIPRITARLLGKAQLVGTPIENAVARAVFRTLLFHETFHHFVELAISRFETVGLESAGGLPPLYERNFHQPLAVLLEEALANAYALKRLERYASPMGYTMRMTTLALLAKYMEGQPAGYRDFEQYLQDKLFIQGKDSLLDEVKKTLSLPRPTGGDDGLLAGRFHFVETALPAECRVRLAIERHAGAAVLRPFPVSNGMQVFVYTRNEHPPPHFHLFMPPGREHGSYEWPSLEPLKGAPALSRKDAGRLRTYLENMQPEIYRKILAVYPNAEDLV